jgi:3-methyl-2-oxobutanoate hydroxymethyltransferase
MSVTVRDLRAFKERGERFVMLTAYDYPTARILDESGIPVILVGDSVGNNVLGYETTIPVTMQEMLHHTRAVVRGATNALVVGDMPFMSFHTAIEDAIANAGRFLSAP